MGDPESPFYVRPRLDWGLFSWGYHFWRASTRARARRAGPLLRDLNLASRSLFEELAEGSGNSFGLRREGLLLLLRTERGFEEERELAERSRELGMPAEVLDRSQVQALEPQVTFDVLGGIRYPLDAHLIPQELIRTLTRLVKAREAGFVWNAEVRDLRRAGDSVAAAVTSQRAGTFAIRAACSDAGSASACPCSRGKATA